MTGEDPALSLPEPPPLVEPLAPLDVEPRTDLAGDAATPFVVAGRRACVRGDTRRGPDEIRTHPVRIASDLRIAGAATGAVTITPLGLERGLRVGDVPLIERIVVPRDGPACLFEWHAPGGTTTFEVAWVSDLSGSGPEGVPASIRWRRSPRGTLVVAPGHIPEDGPPGPVEAGYRALFAFSDGLRDLDIEDASGHAPAVRVRARIEVPAGGSVRLVMAGAPAHAAAERALRSAARARALVLARRGAIARLRQEHLSVATPDSALDRGVERARFRLADRLVDTPGVGRSFVAGYEPGRLSYTTADAVAAALDSLLLGDFDAARDVLRFLGSRLDPDGHVPADCTLRGAVERGDADGTTRYLLLAARFLAWTGDLAFMRNEWPRIRRACEPVLRETPARAGGAPTHDGLADVAPLAELVPAAEAVGDAPTAALLRDVVSTGAVSATPAADSRDPLVPEAGGPGPIARFRRILGPEPDASRGRLVLRPRPPAAWDRFDVHALRTGDAAVSIRYRRRGDLHSFRVAQDRGNAPLRLILAPELPGRFRAARVDGIAADLEAVTGGDRTQVPVQLALDHPRTIEVQMDHLAPLVARPPSTRFQPGRQA